MAAVLLLIFGLLLLLFGGGCVLLVSMSVIQDPRPLANLPEAVNIAIVTTALGVAPLLVGGLMVWNGVRRLRGRP